MVCYDNGLLHRISIKRHVDDETVAQFIDQIHFSERRTVSPGTAMNDLLFGDSDCDSDTHTVHPMIGSASGDEAGARTLLMRCT